MKEDYYFSKSRKAKNLGYEYGPAILGAGLGSQAYRAVPSKYRYLAGGAGASLGAYLGKRYGSSLRKRKEIQQVKEGPMHKVDSSMIKSIADTPEGMYVRFNTGRVYRYPKARMSRGVRHAESSGKFFNKRVKGKYDYEQV